MPIVQVPIDKVVPGMYLVGIDVSWKGSSFIEHEFLIQLKLDIDTLKSDGATLVDVDTAKSKVSCDGQGFKIKTVATKVPGSKRKSSSEPVEFDRELDTAKEFRSETVDSLKQIFISSKDGKPVKQEEIKDIVSESHDSILRNSHALLSLFHSGGQDSDLENHSFNVMSLSIMLGEKLGLSAMEISHLGSAALLMDIGWSELPPDLFKNGSPYTDDEFELVRTHVDIGVEILEDGNIPSEVVNLVAKHHERMDGCGYFSYREEHDIPVMCRILSMADHYNSRIRGYYDSPPMIPSSVLKDIYTKAKKGSHDVSITESLVQLVGIFPVSSAVQLSSGEKGIVTKVNWRDPMNPTVTVYYDKFGKKLARPVKIDLSRQDKKSLNVRKIKTMLNVNDRGVDPAGLLNFNV